MRMRRADRLSTGAPHFVSDMVVETPLRSLGRNGGVARIGGAPYGVAILKTNTARMGNEPNAHAAIAITVNVIFFIIVSF